MIERLGKEIVQKILKDNCAKDDTVYYCPQNPVFRTKEEGNYYYRNLFVNVYATKFSFRCSCKKAKELGEDIEVSGNRPTCPYCGTDILNAGTVLFKPSTKKELEKLIQDKKQGRNRYNTNIHTFYGEAPEDVGPTYFDGGSVLSRVMRFKTYYVREKLDGNGGIEIARLRIFDYVDENGRIQTEEKYDCFVDINPGEEIKAYKRTKAKGTEEISLFDAFHISSDNLTEEENIVFEGANSMIDFVYYNPKFAKCTGFINLLQNYTGKIPENSLFLLYMYLLSEYPVIELLVKMGYNSLVMSLFEDVQTAYRRDTIREKVRGFEKLLNQTTKGKGAISVPSYIGSYLNAKNANLNEYMSWAMIYETEKISEEQFKKIISSEVFLYCNYYNVLDVIPNIMKYGYTFHQCMKYITKQSYFYRGGRVLAKNQEDYRTNMRAVANLWKDYLQMCELLGVEAADMPKDILAVHNETMRAKSALENKNTDIALECIGSAYDGFKTESKQYCVVFPKSTRDFIEEGNRQHNCVGHYTRDVFQGLCRIFFIRKKDSPEDSYITGECRKSGLGQLMYRNNQFVDNYIETELARAVCKYILSKPWEPSNLKELKVKTN